MTSTNSKSETHIAAFDKQIIIYPPPGPSILDLRSYILQPPTSVAVAQPELPSELKSAVALRFSVFVNEQKASPKSELDSDDPRSWHWVALVAPQDGSASFETERTVLGEGETEIKHVVAATLRLVPVSSTPPETEVHGTSPTGFAERPAHRPTALWDGHEPYIKIGRVATLPPYRKMGLGKLLVESVVEWAGRHRAILRQSDGELTQGNTEGAPENQWSGLILVHAQTVAKRFWEKSGFVEDEGMGVWWEEGLEHVGMWRRVNSEV